MTAALRKRDLERICANAGMPPVSRGAVQGREVFIADGFSAWPHDKFTRFGLGRDVYPMGAYVTLWWLAKGEDSLGIGGVFLCESLHDPGYTIEGKKQLRINEAMRQAREFVRASEKVTKH